MRGVYTGRAKHNQIAAAADLLVIENVADQVLEIRKMSITNLDNETNEQLQACIYRATANASGTDSTQVAMKPHEVGDQACSAIVEFDHGSPATLEAEPVWDEGFASLAGWFFDPAPEDLIYVPPAGIIVLHLLTPTFTALDILAQVTLREIG